MNSLPINELPLVSICIPTYNGEDFIAEALASALAQTYPQIEVILSDDNSSDRTIELAKLFQKDFSGNFSIIPHQQYGLAHNWNFCIAQAKGKYIKFLFQDDLLEPECIAAMVNLAEQDDDIGLVFSPRGVLLEGGADSNRTFKEIPRACIDLYKGWSSLKSIQWGQELLTDPNLLDNPINKIGEPTTVLIRKEVFDKVGFFDPELPQLLDVEMWLRIMGHYKIGFVNQTLSHFRLHPQQQTQKNINSKSHIVFLDKWKFFDKLSRDLYYTFLPQDLREQAFCGSTVSNLLYSARIDSDDPSALLKLRQARRQTADRWLTLQREQLQSQYLGPLGKGHQWLKQYDYFDFKDELLTETEQTFAEELVAHLSTGFATPQAINYLLAAMLYCRADQLPLPYDLTHIPEWLLQDYLEFIFAAPANFQERGEAQQYYHHIQEWIDYLHTSILSHPDSAFWGTVATRFLDLTSSFIPLYSTEFNLKDLYRQRAEILEFALLSDGYEVDYDFTEPPKRTKVRLGILAAQFGPSAKTFASLAETFASLAETFASLPVYEHLSQDEFEVILYSALGSSRHPLEQYCRHCASSFKVLPTELIDQVDTIRADDLDILYIATNVTAANYCLSLLAVHRLARVQIASAASLVTTGMRHVDYYLSGQLSEPHPEAEQHYQEKLVKLDGPAHCFSYGPKPNPVTTTIDRVSLGLSPEAVVFMSGAHSSIVTPELSHAWATILAAVPNSVLLLLPFDANHRKQLRSAFSKQGIESDRLMFLDPDLLSNREKLKAHYRLADVYLDTYPCSGTTALIEPLEVGLPVVAKQGTFLRTATGGALLQELGVPDLVADTEAAYIKLAIALGTDAALRHQKQEQIQQAMYSQPRFLNSHAYSAQVAALLPELLRQKQQELWRKQQQRATFKDTLQQRDLQLIVFPDWQQSEESLLQDLGRVMCTLVAHPQKSRMILLVDASNTDAAAAKQALGSIVSSVLPPEALTDPNGPVLFPLGQLSETQWQALLPRLCARLVLVHEDQETLSATRADTIPAWELDNLNQPFS